MTNLTESSAQCSPALPPASSMHLLVRLKAKDEGWFLFQQPFSCFQLAVLNRLLCLCYWKAINCVSIYEQTRYLLSLQCVCQEAIVFLCQFNGLRHTWVYKRHRIITLCIERTLTWCLFFPQSLFIPMVFLAVCKLIISMLCNWAGFALIFPVILFLCMLFFLWCFQSLKIIMHFIVPVIELSFFLFIPASFFTFPWHVAVCFYKCVCVCTDICGCVCQYLQRIWKRASGRWRGSSCNWRETWRLSPPPMTKTTCSLLKWLYPLHKHAFTHQSRELFNGFTVMNQMIQKLEEFMFSFNSAVLQRVAKSRLS